VIFDWSLNLACIGGEIHQPISERALNEIVPRR